MPILLKYALLWFPMVLIAIGNGAIRDLAYSRYVGEFVAHQISTVSLLLLFTIYIGCIIYVNPLQNQSQAYWVGFIWVVLTVCLEFGMGRFRGNSWSQLLEDYNIAKGRLWILIPVWVGIAPYFFYFLMNR